MLSTYSNSWLSSPAKLKYFQSMSKRSDIAEILEVYERDLPSAYATDMDLQAWRLKWHGRPEGALLSTQPPRH